MREKGNASCGWLINWKFTSQKWVLWTANGQISMPHGHTPLDVTHRWGPASGLE